MKYQHAFHAGNFADLHKHVTLLALLTALKRKDKGFLYLETHAGRGAYDLSNPTAETTAGIGRFCAGANSAAELQQYSVLLAELRAQHSNPRFYPGSPVLAVHELRPQDRAVLIELAPAEARALEHALEPAADANARFRLECGDGFERLRAWLPPPQRRGLTFIDPPYEETMRDFERVAAAIAEALRRFRTGIIAAWYPIKDEREIAAWRAGVARRIDCETLASELWLYPRDSRVSLNGSGMLIVNPPYLLAERMRTWLPELQRQLDVGHQGGTSIQMVPAGAS